MNRQLFRRMSGALLVSLAVGGCFDTSIIPPESAAGAAGVGGGGKRSTPTAGRAPVATQAGDGTGDRGGSGDGGADIGGDGGRIASGGSVAGGRGGDVASAGQAGEPGASGVTWLSLAGSQAPSSAGANGSLGINGAFYAYKDDCATLTWNEATRCASGQLCTAGANYENWGVAVGFDFDATGPGGTPPSSKLVWNPEQAGVRGVTWRIRGPASGLQLWVLNMAPRFQGQCSEITCEIAGPPDGSDQAPLTGTLLFDQMVKDTWAGGIAYAYDPAAVFALQFKLPAIRLGAVPFDFCVEALGVVH